MITNPFKRTEEREEEEELIQKSLLDEAHRLQKEVPYVSSEIAEAYVNNRSLDGEIMDEYKGEKY